MIKRSTGFKELSPCSVWYPLKYQKIFKTPKGAGMSGRKSKDRQYNSQKQEGRTIQQSKTKRTDKDLQSTTQKTKGREMRTQSAPKTLALSPTQVKIGPGQ